MKAGGALAVALVIVGFLFSLAPDVEVESRIEIEASPPQDSWIVTGKGWNFTEYYNAEMDTYRQELYTNAINFQMDNGDWTDLFFSQTENDFVIEIPYGEAGKPARWKVEKSTGTVHAERQVFGDGEWGYTSLINAMIWKVVRTSDNKTMDEENLAWLYAHEENGYVWLKSKADFSTDGIKQGEVEITYRIASELKYVIGLSPEVSENFAVRWRVVSPATKFNQQDFPDTETEMLLDENAVHFEDFCSINFDDIKEYRKVMRVWKSGNKGYFEIDFGDFDNNIVLDPTTNLTPSIDAYVHKINPDTNYGTSASIVVGNFGTENSIYRGLLKFSVNLLSDANITNVTLNLYNVTLAREPVIGVYNQTDLSWTEAGVTWSNQPAFESSPTDNIVIDDVIQWWSWIVTSDVPISDNVGWTIKLLDETAENNVSFYSEDFDGFDPYLEITYVLDPPNAPTNLWCEDQTNPTQITDFTPEFSAIFTDNTPNDNAENVQIWVGTSVGDNSMWDSGWLNILDIYPPREMPEPLENGQRCWDITYAGSTLSRGATYHWRIRFMDNYGGTGLWSTETATFRINQLPATTNLKTEGQTDPTHVTMLTPTFSWDFSDADEDNQSHWRIWVGTSPGSSDKWDSGEMSGADNSDEYDGSALSRGETYYVQARSRDNLEWANWSSGSFRINQLPTQTYATQKFYMNPPYTPTLKWWFSDPDGDGQLGIKIQVDNDSGFGSLLWNYSDNTTIVQSKVYAGETLEKNVTYYARCQVRDGYEWSGAWSDNTFTILPIPSLVVAEVVVDRASVDRKAHWLGDGDVRIYVTVKDNEGRDAIENAYLWMRDNNDAVVVDNIMLIAYENIDDNTKRFWYDYIPSDTMLDNALGEFDVKVQAVSANFENTKDYTGLGFKLFTVDDHSITFSPVREIYVEGELITVEPIVKSVATGLDVDNAYLKLELISELGEVLRVITGYTNPSGKLATHTTLLEADIGFYDIGISTSKGAIDGFKIYEDAFNVVAELLVSVEGVTPADDSISGLLRSRSIVPEDVIVKVLVFDTAGTELLTLTSDSMRVENIAPQLKSWQVPYGLTLAEGTYSYRVEVWKADLGTLHHVAFAEVRLAVAPSQQAVGDWLATDTIEIEDEKFDVVLRRESIVTNPETVDKSNFLFKESIPAPQGSTVMVKVSGLPATTLSVDKYGMITKYFDVKASTTVKIEMEVTIACAVKIEALGETEVVTASVPKTVAVHEWKVTNLTDTTLRGLMLTFPVDEVVSVVDVEGRPFEFWESKSTAVEIPILEPYEEMTLTLTAEKTSSLPDMAREIITWTIYGIPIIIPLLVLGVILCVILWALTRKTRKKAGPISHVIVLLLPLIIFIGLWALGAI